MSFIHYRTKGFIFEKKDLGEADRIISIFTQDFGSLQILAKGERKITSKLRTGLELFSLSEIEFIQGKTYKILTDASPKKRFKNIQNDLERLEIAFKISEILKNFLKFQEPDKKLWNLLISTFKELNDLKLKIENSLEIGNPAPELSARCGAGWKLEILHHYFLWNFISILGYQPELNCCILCQEKFKGEKLFFSSKEEGLICQNCFKKMSLQEKDYISKINLKVLKTLKTL